MSVVPYDEQHGGQQYRSHDGNRQLRCLRASKELDIAAGVIWIAGEIKRIYNAAENGGK